MIIKWVVTLNYYYYVFVNTQSNASQQAAATRCWELSSISSLDRHAMLL